MLVALWKDAGSYLKNRNRSVYVENRTLGNWHMDDSGVDLVYLPSPIICKMIVKQLWVT